METALWQNNIKEAVQNIADGRFQEQAWFGESDQISSPDDEKA